MVEASTVVCAGGVLVGTRVGGSNTVGARASVAAGGLVFTAIGLAGFIVQAATSMIAMLVMVRLMEDLIFKHLAMHISLHTFHNN
jgi:hypothetical protein